MLKFIPVRGRKLFRLSYKFGLLSVEIYPREGTETFVRLDFVESDGTLKFIPVRGRKRASPAPACPSAVEIYPREGTETLRGLLTHAHTQVEIYPREGTETAYGKLLSGTVDKLKFIPVRGRKPFRTFLPSVTPALKFIPVRGRKQVDLDTAFIDTVEIYPREGTETLCVSDNHNILLLKFIPVRGRKL